MKRFYLEEEERRTLFEMGMWYRHARVRRRAQALVRLAQGVTQTQVAKEFGVHLNSVRGWMGCWQRAGLVGLHVEKPAGRPRKLSAVVAERLRQVALAEGGTVRHIMQCMEERRMPLLVEPGTVQRWLKEMGFSYKRYRTSLKKKRDAAQVARFSQQLATLREQAQAGTLALCFFDEAGFSPIPPVQSGWSVRGQTRSCCPDAHKQRVNVLGCLQKGARLIWETVTHPVARADVIAFFDRLANGLTQKTVVVLDNAGIHHGAPMRERQAQWEQQGLHLLYLPPYSPELNAIEILWKQAKYFWRRFLTLSGTALQEEVEDLMRGFGTHYTIAFR
ncbi:MAG TPA: IS630 family transposase [Noviherbaspirillum sp.]